MKRRLTPRGEERRQQILSFATKRFADVGFHPTSVTEIVEGIGVGKGVFYWYFDSKQELFFQILRDAQRDLRRAQYDAIVNETDALNKIEMGIRATMRWSAANRDLNTLFQFASTEKDFAGALRKGGEVAAADIISIVSSGIESGQIRDSDPVVLAHAIFGCTAYLARTFIHDQQRDPEEVADEAVAFCLEGLLAPRRSDSASVTPTSSPN